MPSLAWLALILLIPPLAALTLRYLFVRAADRSDAELHPAEELADEMATAFADIVDPVVCGEREDHAPLARHASEENAEPAGEAPDR